MTQKALLQSAGDGTAVPAGYVGERITWITAPSSFAPTTVETDWTNAFITLTPGIWMVVANIEMGYGSNSGGSGNTQFKITDSSNNLIQNMNKQVGGTVPGTSGWAIYGVASGSFIANLSSTTTYKIRVFKVDGSGVGNSNVFNTSSAYSEFYAVRIA